MSGWSRSRVTIFAARLVVPPDFIAPALLSPIFKNDINPEDFPPPLKDSFAPLTFEKFEPVPEPYLNSLASRTHRSIIPPSLTRSSDKRLNETRMRLRMCICIFGSSKLFCISDQHKNVPVKDPVIP